MMSSAIAQIDVIANFAHQARLNNWARPEFTPETGIKIQGGRHPVVEALSKAPFTPNDTFLDVQHRMAIITGPNMGGKSTFMRQTALVCLLTAVVTFRHELPNLAPSTVFLPVLVQPMTYQQANPPLWLR